jgi:hypothetical protein
MQRALARDGDLSPHVRADAFYTLAICEYGLGNDALPASLGRQRRCWRR